MKILKIISQYRKDFSAIMICEYCNHEEEIINGYDVAFYYENIIPEMKCNFCGKIA